MSQIAVVSFRLGELDGVSIEAQKWVTALRVLGHHVTTIAGAGIADRIIPGLAMGASSPPLFEDVRDALDDTDVVIVENLVSLPLNRGAADILYDVLKGRRALLHHHDLPWQREQWLDEPAPRDEPLWLHVTINDLSTTQLSRHGIRATTIRNTFNCDPPKGDRETTRALLSIGDERLLLFPSRSIPRKNVSAAFTLAKQLDATLWLLGPSEDDFEEELERLIATSDVRVRRGAPPNTSIHDAYAACDLVVVPSTWEGFGNPVLESVTHRRPLAVFPYPVLEEIRTFGFTFYDIHDAEIVNAVLASPLEDVLDANLRIAREHFNEHDLPDRLRQLLVRMGVS